MSYAKETNFSLNNRTTKQATVNIIMAGMVYLLSKDTA